MNKIFIFLFLVIFPFGQLFHLGFNLFGISIAPQPLDIVVGLAALWSIFAKYKKPNVFKYLDNFLIFALFSFVLSIFIFKTPLVVYGFLYLIRLSAYIYFLVYVWNFVRSEKTHARLLIDSLLAVSIVSAVFGWIQYLLFSDLRALKILGWDDHLYRMVGTFLDPGFLGIIIVLGVLVSMYLYIDTKKPGYILGVIFLIVSLAFTYSRASYLSLFAGLAVFGYFYRKYIKRFLVGIAMFLVLILILPTSKNHILSFTREFSAIARILNYQETLDLIKKYPLFGVGFDNLCLVKNNTMLINFYSHSCSGADSSILFILATTGIVGFIILTYGVKHIVYSLKHSAFYILLTTSFIALLVHSLFSNSLFYPWIMGYMVILLAVTLREKNSV